MRYRIFLFFLIYSLIIFFRVCSTSMVYNFRIAQITKQFQFDSEEDKRYTAIALFFDQIMKKHNGNSQNYLGGFGSLIYNFDNYYIRMDSAFAHINNKQKGLVTFSGMETDDILFTFGCNFIKKKKDLITASWLLGVPTHEIHALEHTDFGYGQTGIGFQIDGSHSYSANDKHIFLYGARYIGFIPRTAFDVDKNRYKFTIGNLGDLFVADKHNWGNQGIEYGYTSKFSFGAKINPKFDDIIKKTNYIRSNFYIVYKYKFLIGETSNKLLLYFSYGFDHIPKMYGNKYILTFWTSWNISF